MRAAGEAALEQDADFMQNRRAWRASKTMPATDAG
jgi:hypothetical protein